MTNAIFSFFNYFYLSFLFLSFAFGLCDSFIWTFRGWGAGNSSMMHGSCMPLERVIVMFIQLIERFMVVQLIDCFMFFHLFMSLWHSVMKKLSAQDRLIQCLPPQPPLKCTPIACFHDNTSCPVAHAGQ